MPGLSYIDFNLFGTGTQVNGFFGGTYGQLAFSVPSLGGTRWQLAGQAFGIASSYNDRAFVQGREHYEWNISQRPAHAAVWVLRPLSARLTMRAGYELDYTGFDESDSTVSTFAVPAAQVAHGLRLALEGQWDGWTPSVWWVGARRSGWRPWGEGDAHPELVGVGEYRDEQRDYQRSGAALARSVVFSSRLVGRVEAACMTGRDLDRFSRYTFGSFDNRLRGYPSALIRYDRGAVVRGVRGVVGGRLAPARRFPRLRLRARSRLRAARPQLHRRRRGRGGSRAVRHAGRRRVGLRFQGVEQRRPAGHPGSARHRV